MISAEKKKILIVEDEKDLARLLQYNLRKDGFHTFSIGRAETALALARKINPDLAIVDIMLPTMDGLEFCRLIRQESQVPVIFLTAKKSETDRIVGLKLGADDYITKPFSFGELAARIQTILRRSAGAPNNNGAKPHHSVAIGDMEIDFDKHEIQVRGKPIDVTPKEFELLRRLVESKGKVLSREKLLEIVWGHDKAAELDTRTVDQHVARLRKKLRHENKRIVTVTNYGYQFNTR